MGEIIDFDKAALDYQNKVIRQTIDGLNLVSKNLAKANRYFMLNLDFIQTDYDIYRQITVPAEISFLDLHIIIQDCFNWMDYHLFDFQYVDGKALKMIAERTIGNPIEDPARVKALEAQNIKLDAVFPKTRVVKYSYDYGDGWELLVTLLSEATAYGGVTIDAPFCNEGSGTVPPEDVGGWGGFEVFLDTINNKSDPEYAYMSAWAKEQGFEKKFDQKKANARMAKWKAHKKLHEQNR